MGIITDVLAGIPLNAVQRQKIEDQEKRLAELELENKGLRERLNRYEAQPGEKCPSCRAPLFSLVSNSPSSMFPGSNNYHFCCSGCGFEETIDAISAGHAWNQVRGT